MRETEIRDEDGYFTLLGSGELLFTIRCDGTIERGPGFTTVDEMSLEFWKAVQNLVRPLN